MTVTVTVATTPPVGFHTAVMHLALEEPERVLLVAAKEGPDLVVDAPHELPSRLEALMAPRLRVVPDALDLVGRALENGADLPLLARVEVDVLGQLAHVPIDALGGEHGPSGAGVLGGRRRTARRLRGSHRADQQGGPEGQGCRPAAAGAVEGAMRTHGFLSVGPLRGASEDGTCEV